MVLIQSGSVAASEHQHYNPENSHMRPSRCGSVAASEHQHYSAENSHMRPSVAQSLASTENSTLRRMRDVQSGKNGTPPSNRHVTTANTQFFSRAPETLHDSSTEHVYPPRVSETSAYILSSEASGSHYHVEPLPPSPKNSLQKNSIDRHSEDFVPKSDFELDDENDPETRQFMELIMREVSYAAQRQDEGHSDSHWLIDSMPFVSLVGILILLNTVQMGLEAEFPEYETLWLVCENVFTAAFLLEMIVKLRCLGLRTYSSDTANWLDSVIVCVSIIDCWLLSAFSDMGSGNMQTLSILRVVRLVRLVRVLRIVKHLNQLVIVIRGVISAIRMTFWIACVVFLSVYVGAIVCTEYIGRGTETLYPGYTTDVEVIDEQEIIFNFNPYLTFGSMPKAMLTLFNIALMAEWVEVIRPISLKQPILMVFFLAFLFFTAFGVMNVMVGMIVDNVYKESARMDADEFEVEKRRKLAYLGKIRELFWKNIDKDGDGVIGVGELSATLSEEGIGHDLRSLLNRMKIPLGLKAEELLYMLDNDGDGEVHYNEFVKSFFRLIESTEFQQICIVQMGVNHIKKLIRDSGLETRIGLKSLQDEVQMLRNEIACKIEHGSKVIGTGHGYHNLSAEKTRDDMLADLIKDSRTMTECKLQDLDFGLQSIAKEIRQLYGSGQKNNSWEGIACLQQNSIQNGSSFSVRADGGCPDTAGGIDLVRIAQDPQNVGDAGKLRCLGKSGNQSSLHDCSDTAISNPSTQSACARNLSPGCFEAVRKIQSQFGSTLKDRAEQTGGDTANGASRPSLPTVCEVTIEDTGSPEGQFGVELKFTHPLISNVRADSVARNNGICSGDVILSCNGLSTWGMSRDGMVQALKQRPLKLELERHLLQS